MGVTLSFKEIEEALLAIQQGRADWRAYGNDLDAASSAVDAALVRLAQRYNQFQRLVDSVPEIIWMQDAEGQNIFLNQAWYRITGLSAEESLGKNWAKAMHPDDIDTAFAKYREALSNKLPNIGECRFMCADGSYRSFSYISTPIFDQNGEVKYWVGLDTDITDLKMIEKKLTTRQAELAHVSRLGLMGEMAIGFAHALNQPLAAMINFAKGCVRRIRLGFAQPDQISDAMRSVVREAERTAELVQRLRRFVRKGETDPQPCDMADVIEEAKLFFEREQKQHWVHLDVQLASGVHSVTAPRIQLLQVVVKLMSRAIESVRECTLEHRQVSLKLWSPDPSHVALVIRDRRPSVKKSMYASSALADVHKDHGRGHSLSVTYTIVHSLGGYLESCLDSQGHVYWLVLPIQSKESEIQRLDPALIQQAAEYETKPQAST